MLGTRTRQYFPTKSLCIRGLWAVSLVIGLSAQAATNILPMGDSITEAEYPYSSYRRLLWRFLEDTGASVDFVGKNRGVRSPASNDIPPDRDFDLNHEGHWGWTTRDMLLDKGGLSARLNRFPAPDIVLLLLGVNDLTVSCRTVAQTQQGLSEIIDVLRARNAEVTVLLGTLLPTNNRMGCGQDANVAIDAFNAALPAFVARESTALSPVILVDQSSDIDRSIDLYDSIHPNLTGERKVALRWYEALLPLLGNEVFSSSVK